MDDLKKYMRERIRTYNKLIQMLKSAIDKKEGRLNEVIIPIIEKKKNSTVDNSVRNS